MLQELRVDGTHRRFQACQRISRFQGAHSPRTACVYLHAEPPLGMSRRSMRLSSKETQVHFQQARLIDFLTHGSPGRIAKGWRGARPGNCTPAKAPLHSKHQFLPARRVRSTTLANWSRAGPRQVGSNLAGQPRYFTSLTSLYEVSGFSKARLD